MSNYVNVRAVHLLPYHIMNTEQNGEGGEGGKSFRIDHRSPLSVL